MIRLLSKNIAESAHQLLREGNSSNSRRQQKRRYKTEQKYGLSATHLYKWMQENLECRTGATLFDSTMIIFSDETKIIWIRSDGRKWTWRKNGSALEARHLNAILKFGCGCILAWECLMARGVGTIQCIVGRITARYYVDILLSNLLVTCQKLHVQSIDIVFQYDNECKHTSKISQKRLKDSEYRLKSWPPQTPDLISIQHFWGELKRSMVRVPTFLNELWGHIDNV